MAEKCKNTNGPVATLGPIIHNPQVVERLQKQGVGVASSLAEFSTGTVVIRSHGVGPSVYQEAESKGLNVVDATCPHVQKAQQAAARVRMPAFEVCFDQVGSFSGGRQHPFVLRSEHGADLLHDLHRELARCLQGVGDKPEPAFTPHLTLLYDKRRLPLQPVQPLRWLVREFVLVRSYLGQTRYQMEGCWALG